MKKSILSLCLVLVVITTMTVLFACGDNGSSGGSNHEHAWDNGTVTKEATCSEPGETTYSCDCGDTYKEDIAKISHTESDWIVVTEVVGATNGLQHKVCTVCGVELATEEIYPEVVASGKLSDATIEWKIIGTTLYVSGDGEIPNFLNIPTSGDELKEWQDYYSMVEKIVIGDGITKIGDRNFALFEKTKEVVLADTVEEIGIQSFYWNKALENLDLNQVTKLGRTSFSQCDNLSKVVIPGTIKNIPTGCFSGADGICEIFIEEGVESISNASFFIDKAGIIIHLPESLKSIHDEAWAYELTVYVKAGSYAEKFVNENAQRDRLTVIVE